MKTCTKILAVISGLCLQIGLLLSIIFALAMAPSFYHYEYTKGNQAEAIGMSDDDLMKATDALLDYIKDDRDDIVETVTVNGYEREVYNERETLHMVDVKNLFHKADVTRYVLLGVSVIGMLIVFMANRKNWQRVFHDGFVYSLWCLLIFIGFILIYAIADFNSFWIQFHYVFFDNDLFFLDPNTSIMINMFPETFFFDLVMGIIVSFGIVETVIYLLVRKGKHA